MTFLDSIKRRVHSLNDNWMAIVCGRTGSGKSYFALKLGELLDPEFNINRICFSIREFMKLINSENLKTGSVVLFDEAGVGIGARDWFTIQNKMFMNVLETFRYRNYIIIFTTPNLGFIDIKARTLFHTYFETLSINRKEGTVRCKLHNIQTNPKSGKSYFKYPKTQLTSLRVMKVGKPSRKLINAYEKKKKVFGKKLYTDVEALLNKIENKEKKKMSNEDYIKIIKKKFGNKIPTVPQIRAVTGTSLHKASMIRELLTLS